MWKIPPVSQGRGISLFCWERNLGPVGEFLGMLYCKINDFYKITKNSNLYMNLKNISIILDLTEAILSFLDLRCTRY
jgi:hypothetical protein